MVVRGQLRARVGRRREVLRTSAHHITSAPLVRRAFFYPLDVMSGPSSG